MKSKPGKLRIIAGSLKGRAVSTIDVAGTRPMTDRVRENLFNILQVSLPGCHFIDLFAGSGAVGFEALSRGASHATFVENSPRWHELIQQNAKALAVEDSCTLLCEDVFTVIPRLAEKTARPAIIFVGAPYEDYLHSEAAKALIDSQALKPGDLAVIQYRKGDPLEEDSRLSYRHKDYGITRLTFMEYWDHE